MKIIVPTSGGKDSLACLLMAIDTVGKENVTSVFNDTGWDHPVTYGYLEYLESELDIKVHSTMGAGGVDKSLPDLIRRYGKFPYGLGRFCTTTLKQYAFRNWFRDEIYDGETVYQVWFGMRTAESRNRAKKYANIANTDIHDIGELFPRRYSKKLRAVLPIGLLMKHSNTLKIIMC
jgi:3'-phosphoadenosine 5'-phosphosulfate sulfotransferase (PAPS reductase)/FAD synthetase